MKTKLLIEQHLHGAFGIDFNKASVDDILYLSKEILKYGIGGIFPTIVTDSVENTKKAIKNIKEASQKQTSDMAKILGIHLEGIFINPEKKGIHNPKHFLAPTIENYKLVEDDFIKIVTLAPELAEGMKLEGEEGILESRKIGRLEDRLVNENNLSEISQEQQTDNSLPSYLPTLQPSNLISYLNSKGVKVQAGHCTGGDLTGCSGVTHLFNAMSGITHRGQSTALSALINDDIYTEIIADGVHVSDDALKLLFKTKPIDKIILISDCLPCTRLKDKKVRRLEDKPLIVENGKLKVKSLSLHTPSPDGEGRDGVIFVENNNISQQSQTDNSLSCYPPTLQPYDTNHTSIPPYIHTSVFADETIYYDGVKATSKDGTLAGSTTLLPEIIKRLAGKLESMRIRGLEDKPLIVENGKLKVESLSSHTPSPDGEGRDGVIFVENNNISQQSQTDNSLPSYHPTLQSSDTDLSPCGFADGRNEVSPDSEQMELSGTECRKRHSVSVEQIQDNRPIALLPENSHTSIEQLISNPYKYHNIDLNGSIEWDENWNIVKVNN